jgi:Asp-tRNA(Asn)/Glu-tRNA(Gln) amidotransferase A subunit family amidase
MISVTRACEQIKTTGETLRAFTSTRLSEAMREDQDLAQAEPRSPLHRAPFSLKDSWDVANCVTTGGSYRYKDRISPSSSPVVEVFQQAGAVLMGKTSLSDLALSLESANYICGETQNPFDSARTSGGSSGGAAAAVASHCVEFDWGSDFGGSIRMPAAFCGIFGMRLSASLWPMVGAFPQVPDSLLFMNGQGPLTRDLQRMRDVLQVAAPRLRRGEASYNINSVALIEPSFGFRGEWPDFALDASHLLARAGVSRQEHALPSVFQASNIARDYLCAHFEDLIDVDEMSFWEGLGAAISAMTIGPLLGDKRLHPRTAEILALLGLGRLLLAPKKSIATERKNRWLDAVQDLWARGAIIAAPVTVFPPPLHGRSNWNPLYTTYTLPWNVVDATCLSIPMGTFPNGLPRGMQLCGPAGSEWALLDLAASLMA